MLIRLDRLDHGYSHLRLSSRWQAVRTVISTVFYGADGSRVGGAGCSAVVKQIES